MSVLVLQSMACVNIPKRTDMFKSRANSTSTLRSYRQGIKQCIWSFNNIKSPLNLKDNSPNNMQCIFTFLNTIQCFFSTCLM